MRSLVVGLILVAAFALAAPDKSISTFAQQPEYQPKVVDVRDSVSDIVASLKQEWGLKDGSATCSKTPEPETCREWIKVFKTVLPPDIAVPSPSYNVLPFGAAESKRGFEFYGAMWVAREQLLPKIKSAKAREEIERSLADINFTFERSVRELR